MIIFSIEQKVVLFVTTQKNKKSEGNFKMINEFPLANKKKIAT